MDVVDEASSTIEADRTEGVRRVQAALDVAGAAECIGCGDDIEAARREALPSAQRCMTCQQRVEKRERSRRGAAFLGDGL